MSIYAFHENAAAVTTPGVSDILPVNQSGVVKQVTNGQLHSTLVNCTAATLAVTAALHAGAIVTLNRAAGIAVTLPAASGSGARFRFIIGTTFTGSATIKVASSSDIMQGNALMPADGGNTVNGWETAADTDTITFDGSTTGGYVGTEIELIDIASGLFYVKIIGNATGSEATPFSATV